MGLPLPPRLYIDSDPPAFIGLIKSVEGGGGGCGMKSIGFRLEGEVDGEGLV